MTPRVEPRQAPYPTYQPPPQAPYPPARTPRGVWIAVGVVAALVLVATIAVAVVGGWLIGTAGGPSIAADQYYTAIKSQNYANAYGHLGAQLRQSLSQQAYTQQAQARDAADGIVTKFAYTTIPMGDPADLTISVTRAGGSTYTMHLRLAKESGVWRVISFDGI